MQIVYDRKSFLPAGFLRSGIFIAKEMLHRKRSKSYAPNYLTGKAKSDAHAHAADLDKDGVVVIPSHFKGEQLAKLQAAFEKIVEGHEDKRIPRLLSNDEVFCGNPEVTDAVLDDFLLEVVGQYYGKPFGVGRAGATRMLPTPPERMGSWQWHHDTRGKQVHIMVLLSDVSSEGQRMSYLRGSHKVYYDRFRGEGDGSRFEVDIGDSAKDRVVECVGPAGTVAIFDSNGLHSGNRNDKQKRDCFIFCYVSHPRHFKQITYPRSVLEKLPEEKRKLIEVNPRLSVVG